MPHEKEVSMSQQEAKRFLEALEADQKLMEEVRAKAADSQSTAEFYAAAAKDLGFDFDALELEAELKARQVALMDGVELDDTELEQVARGKLRYSNASTARWSWSMMSICCGHMSSHAPHLMHSLACPARVRQV